MASTYTPLGVELQATGENAGTWGTKTNTNLQIIEQIAGGFTQQAVSDSGDTTLSVSDGSTGATLSHRMIEFTGTISGNRAVTIPIDVQTFYILRNSTSGSHTVQFKYVSGSGDSVTFAAADKGDKIVFASANDGTNPDIIDLGIVNLSTAQTLTNKTLTSPAIGTSILDTNGNELAKVTATGSAVNEFTIANAATGSGPTISSTGGDTNIDINLLSKGTGTINVKGNSTQPGEIRIFEDTDDGSNYVALKTTTLGSNLSLTLPTADGTSGQALVTNGSGVLSFDTAGITTGKSIAMAIVFG
jgi:hypothetical protein|tara:strand:- start:834 stop:1739 length:906 start_codon:yes stop_codon:yes gene_type:complete